ncbi:hypothetical protein [Reyranella sp.]|uniref:hypothetical protein n=1 Tax=Reyranella sp. TaxID=1929291 RepID=UPI00262837DB|nr:hypothetical protein [Reyranella sp.]HQS18664.1 hypothetical protein [Reyranella sp.]HQT15212.1 hypothetical protein [Reyranella sp.]
MDVNIRVRQWGTWIFSTIFFAWIILAGVASIPVAAIVLLSSTASPPETAFLRLFVACGLLWVVLPVIAYSGLHVWQKTRFPWLALVPGLFAVAPMWLVGELTFGWFWQMS